MAGSRSRHLLFLVHLWVCVPFALIWLWQPSLRYPAAPSVLHAEGLLCGVVFVYLLVRTLLAWYDRLPLPWDYLFPVPDALLISLALFLRREPDSVLLFAYLLPIAEAAGTLSLRWAWTVGLIAVAGALPATICQPPISMLGGIFRLFFLVVMASLVTGLAKRAADLRARLSLSAERNRIALEMHDGVQGQLMTIASQAELVARVAGSDGATAESVASDIRDLARQAADELRFLVHRLRAADLEQGFVSALRQHVHNIERRTDLTIVCDVKGQPFLPAPDAEHALFRIVQEGLNNVRKHARASEVRILLDFEADPFRLVLHDNGVGFDPAPRPAEACNGLESMRERAERAGGSLRIESAPGAGTMLTFTAPARKVRQHDDGTEDPNPAGGG